MPRASSSRNELVRRANQGFELASQKKKIQKLKEENSELKRAIRLQKERIGGLENANNYLIKTGISEEK